MNNKPNVIFIMPDQLRHDFLGCYGADFVSTPNIDRLAEEGLRFERCYSEHPVCVPARVSLLTGMHGFRTGVLDNGQFLRPDYREMGLQTWPELLNDHGYYTAAIGKMHFYPWDAGMGFQYRSITEDKRWIHIRDDYYQHLREAGYRKYHGNEHEGYFEHKGAVINILPWEHTIDHFVGEEACRFINNYGADGPFAMMVGFPGPHCPYDPTEKFLGSINPDAMPPAVPPTEDAEVLRLRNVEGNKRPWNGVDYGEFTTEQIKRVRAYYAAEVQQIDHEVGQILDALERKGLLDNTVILFSADHGDYLGDHGLIGKGTFFETSVHVPMIVRVPEGVERVSESLVTLNDVMATMLAYAGCSIPDYVNSAPLPGLGFDGEANHEVVIGATASGWWIDDGRWRFSRYSTGDTYLYDRDADPNEQVNLTDAPEAKDVRKRLEARLTQTVMTFTTEAHFDHRVYVSDLSQYSWFGREGWQRPFPRKVDDPQALRRRS